ncbi:unnamed protein product [Gadus morhua 'NCC']
MESSPSSLCSKMAASVLVSPMVYCSVYWYLSRSTAQCTGISHGLLLRVLVSPMVFCSVCYPLILTQPGHAEGAALFHRLHKAWAGLWFVRAMEIAEPQICSRCQEAIDSTSFM